MNAIAIQKIYKTNGAKKPALLSGIKSPQSVAATFTEEKKAFGNGAGLGASFKKPANPNAFERFWGLNE